MCKGAFAIANGQGYSRSLSVLKWENIVHLDRFFIPVARERLMNLLAISKPFLWLKQRSVPVIYIIKSKLMGFCVCKVYKTWGFCHWVKVIQFNLQLTRSACKLRTHPRCLPLHSVHMALWFSTPSFIQGNCFTEGGRRSNIELRLVKQWQNPLHISHSVSFCFSFSFLFGVVCLTRKEKLPGWRTLCQ